MAIEHHEHDESRHRFDEILEGIQQGLVAMGSLVTENMLRAAEALRENRLDLVDVVRAADGEVNSMYEDLEHRTFETTARQQPVATDLRFLMAATRILYELERSGDLVVNCVKILERQGGFPDSPRLMGTMDRLMHVSANVFAQGIDAIAEMQEDAGVALDDADDAVDDMVSRFYTEIGEESEEIGLEAAVALSRIGRFTERIADHAVNIGEHITWVVTAEFPGDAKGDPGDQG